MPRLSRPRWTGQTLETDFHSIADLFGLSWISRRVRRLLLRGFSSPLRFVTSFQRHFELFASVPDYSRRSKYSRFKPSCTTASIHCTVISRWNHQTKLTYPPWTVLVRPSSSLYPLCQHRSCHQANCFVSIYAS